MRVRMSNDLIHWVRFFLMVWHRRPPKGATHLSAGTGIAQPGGAGNSAAGQTHPNARRMLNHLYRKPIVTAANLEEALELSHPRLAPYCGILRA